MSLHATTAVQTEFLGKAAAQRFAQKVPASLLRSKLTPYPPLFGREGAPEDAIFLLPAPFSFEEKGVWGMSLHATTAVQTHFLGKAHQG